MSERSIARSGTYRRLRPMTPPAPPPCEPCEQIEIDSAFSYHTLDLHAEIAELRAQRELLAGQLAIASEWGCDRWVEWAVAVLAPKVSHD